MNDENTPTAREVTFAVRTLWWAAGAFVAALAAIFGAIQGWNAITDRVDNHWRLESIQQSKDRERDAKDRENEAAIKAAREKAADDTKALADKTAADMKRIAQRAEVGAVVAAVECPRLQGRLVRRTARTLSGFAQRGLPQARASRARRACRSVDGKGFSAKGGQGMTPTGVIVAGIALVVLALAWIFWPDSNDKYPPED